MKNKRTTSFDPPDMTIAGLKRHLSHITDAELRAGIDEIHDYENTRIPGEMLLGISRKVFGDHAEWWVSITINHLALEGAYRWRTDYRRETGL